MFNLKCFDESNGKLYIIIDESIVYHFVNDHADFSTGIKKDVWVGNFIWGPTEMTQISESIDDDSLKIYLANFFEKEEEIAKLQ